MGLIASPEELVIKFGAKARIFRMVIQDTELKLGAIFNLVCNMLCVHVLFVAFVADAAVNSRILELPLNGNASGEACYNLSF